MLQSNFKTGTPSRGGDTAQPFGSHPAKGRDGSNVVRSAYKSSQPADDSLMHYGVPRAACSLWGALGVKEHSEAAMLYAGDNHPQEAGLPWP